jgi:hypothetical protein
MATGRTNSSGFVVKTGSAKNPYLRPTSGYIALNPGGGNLSTQVPVYTAPSINYNEPIRATTSGTIVPVR